MLSLAARVVPVLLALAFAAGCSNGTVVTEVEESEPETVAAEVKAEPTAEAAAAECPNLPAPTCGEGQRLRLKADTAGCLIPTCGECTARPAPTCKAGQTLKTSNDERGCGFSYCATE